MNRGISSASETVLKSAILATRPGGATSSYFVREGHWEAPDRQRFAKLINGTSTDGAEFQRESLALLRRLNGTYRTRHACSDLPNVNRCVVRRIASFRSAYGTQVDLLNSTDDMRRTIGDLVVECLREIRRA